MAKAFYGTQITDLIGSIGGLTFQKANQNAVVRHRPIAAKALTPYQTAQNAIFSQAVEAWAALTTYQQGLWSAFGLAHPKLDYYGVSKSLSGYNWFVSLYITATVLELTPLSVPPTYAAVGQPTPFTVALVPRLSVLDLLFNPAYAHFGQSLLFFASPLILSPTYSNRSNMFYIHRLDTDGDASVSLWTQYMAAFMDGGDFTCSASFVGGIKIGVVAVSRTTFISSAMTFNFSVFYP